MRWLSMVALAFLTARPQDGAVSPVAAMQRHELEVVHWEGSFGTYLHPAAGGIVVVNLDRVGSRELVSYSSNGGESTHTFDLGFLAVASDETSGDAARGWTRRVLLKGRHTPDSPDKTVLDLLIRYEVERFELREGKQQRQCGNTTHVNLRLHTVRDDETIQEYGRARAYHDRDGGVRVPESKSR